VQNESHKSALEAAEWGKQERARTSEALKIGYAAAGRFTLAGSVLTITACLLLVAKVHCVATKINC